MKRNALYALTIAATLLPACFDVDNTPLETEGGSGGSESGLGTADTSGSAVGASTSMGDDSAVADTTGGPEASTGADAAADGDASTGAEGTDDATQDESTDTDGGSEGGSTDTGLAACSAEETCTASAPAGWSGPAVAFLGAGEAPGCPEGYSDLVVDAGLGLNAPAAQCSCSCGEATGWECSVDVTEAGNQCGDFVSGADTFTISAQECESISTNDSAFIASSVQLDLTGANCNPSSSETVPPATWDTSVALCEGNVAASCDEGPCLPNVDAPFGDVCIYTGGIEECPAGPYSEQTIAYNSVTDTRQCSTCECDDPTGFCSGPITYQTGCGPGLIGVYATDNPPGCQNLGGDPGGIFFNGDATVSCAAQGGDPTGSASPLGAVTVCCMPS